MSSAPVLSQILSARTYSELSIGLQAYRDYVTVSPPSRANQEERLTFFPAIGMILQKIDDIFSQQEQQQQQNNTAIKEEQSIEHQLDALDSVKGFFSVVSFHVRTLIVLQCFNENQNYGARDGNDLAQRMADCIIFTVLSRIETLLISDDMNNSKNSTVENNDDNDNDGYRMIIDDGNNNHNNRNAGNRIISPFSETLISLCNETCLAIRDHLSAFYEKRKQVPESNWFDKSFEHHTAQWAQLNIWILAFDTSSIAAFMLRLLKMQAAQTENGRTANERHSFLADATESIVALVGSAIGFLARRERRPRGDNTDVDDNAGSSDDNDDSSSFCTQETRNTLLEAFVACRSCGVSAINELCAAMMGIVSSTKGAEIFTCSETAESFTSVLQALEAGRERRGYDRLAAAHRPQQRRAPNDQITKICSVVATLSIIADADQATATFAHHRPLASILCRMLQNSNCDEEVTALANAMMIFSFPKCRASMFASMECRRAICAALLNTEVMTEKSFGKICGIFANMTDDGQEGCRAIAADPVCFESLLRTLMKLNDFSVATFVNSEIQVPRNNNNNNNDNDDEGESECWLEILQEHRRRIKAIIDVGMILCSMVSFSVVNDLQKNETSAEPTVTEIVVKQFSKIMSTLNTTFGNLWKAKQKEFLSDYNSSEPLTLDRLGDEQIYEAAVYFEILRCLCVNIMKNSEDHHAIQKYEQKQARNTAGENEVLAMPFGGMYRGSLKMGKTDSDENEESEPHRNEILRDWIAVSSLTEFGLNVVVEKCADAMHASRSEALIFNALKNNSEFYKSVECVQQQFEARATSTVMLDLNRRNNVWEFVVATRQKILSKIRSQVSSDKQA